jgi:phosphoglucomutase
MGAKMYKKRLGSILVALLLIPSILFALNLTVNPEYFSLRRTRLTYLEQLVSSVTSEAVSSLDSETRLVIHSGSSGVGQGTIKEGMLDKYSGRFQRLLLYATRDRRGIELTPNDTGYNAVKNYLDSGGSITKEEMAALIPGDSSSILSMLFPNWSEILADVPRDTIPTLNERVQVMEDGNIIIYKEFNEVHYMFIEGTEEERIAEIFRLRDEEGVVVEPVRDYYQGLNIEATREALESGDKIYILEGDRVWFEHVMDNFPGATSIFVSPLSESEVRDKMIDILGEDRKIEIESLNFASLLEGGIERYLANVIPNLIALPQDLIPSENSAFLNVRNAILALVGCQIHNNDVEIDYCEWLESSGLIKEANQKTGQKSDLEVVNNRLGLSLDYKQIAEISKRVYETIKSDEMVLTAMRVMIGEMTGRIKNRTVSQGADFDGKEPWDCANANLYCNIYVRSSQSPREFGGSYDYGDTLVNSWGSLDNSVATLTTMVLEPIYNEIQKKQLRLDLTRALNEGNLSSALDPNGDTTYANILECLGEDYGDSWREIKSLVDSSNWEELKDKFYTNAKFGTAGMRGKMGVGTNRINIYALRRVAQAVADDLKNNFSAKDLKSRPYIISYDTREGSVEFAQEAASILAANGIRVAIATEDRPIGWFAHTVPTLNGLGGMMITASHNPVGNNGIKLSAAYGGQLLPQDGQAISDNFPNIELSSVVTMDYAQAKEQGLISELGEAENEEYMASVAGLVRDSRLTDEERGDITIVYDGLYGTDRETTPDAMRALGHDVVEVEEHAIFDPKFTGLTVPNPTDLAALTLAREQANGIIEEDVNWRQLTGNEIWALTAEYLLNRMLEEGVDLNGKKIVRSWATTSLIDAVVEGFNEKHGTDIEVIVTPVGFKWIGGLAKDDTSIIAGFEESNGATLLAHSLEKDGTLTAALFTEAIAYWNSQLNPDGEAIAIISNDADGDRLVVEVQEGSIVLQQLENIRAEYGEINDAVDNSRFEGPEGMSQRGQIVRGIASNPPAMLGEFKIVDVQDGIRGVKDGVMILLEDGSTILLRESGTEPIMRIYVNTKGDIKSILDAIKGYVAQQLELINP